MTRRYINLRDRAHNLPFSDAVLVDDTLYIAGRIGIDPKTGLAPDDVDEEIRLLLSSFRAVLTDAGMTMDDLVYVQVYSPDLSLFDAFNMQYRHQFKEHFPARAFLGSGPLLRNGRFEMIGIARRK